MLQLSLNWCGGVDCDKVPIQIISIIMHKPTREKRRRDGSAEVVMSRREVYDKFHLCGSTPPGGRINIIG